MSLGRGHLRQSLASGKVICYDKDKIRVSGICPLVYLSFISTGASICLQDAGDVERTVEVRNSIPA